MYAAACMLHVRCVRAAFALHVYRVYATCAFLHACRMSAHMSFKTDLIVNRTNMLLQGPAVYLTYVLFVLHICYYIQHMCYTHVFRHRPDQFHSHHQPRCHLRMHTRAI